jgi:hypothetical protein
MSKTLRVWLLLLPVFIPTFLYAADFDVTALGTDSFYTINGQAPNPTLTLTRGQTYTFEVNADPSHPFFIFPEEGVSNNNTADGTITFAVPLDAPDSLSYFCSIHGFGGAINVINAPLPPAPNVKIISISLTSSNVTLKSTGTNGWAGIPEFSSNLLSSSWSVVPNYSNSFSNGTNTAVFNRLEAICGPNVFLRVRNTTNAP